MVGGGISYDFEKTSQEYSSRVLGSVHRFYRHADLGLCSW